MYIPALPNIPGPSSADDITHYATYTLCSTHITSHNDIRTNIILMTHIILHTHYATHIYMYIYTYIYIPASPNIPAPSSADKIPALRNLSSFCFPNLFNRYCYHLYYSVDSIFETYVYVYTDKFEYQDTSGEHKKICT
jgi:hypothetical protein